VFLHLDADSRSQLIAAFDRIASNPFASADITVPGESETPFCEIKLLGGLVITYYVDHAVKTVSILSVERS
jgi:hypothetical protein